VTARGHDRLGGPASTVERTCVEDPPQSRSRERRWARGAVVVGFMVLALVAGTISFEDSHSYERMKEPRVRAVKERVELIPDPKLMDPDARRSGHVEVKLRDGRTVSHFTRHAPGTKENPLTTEEVSAKARSLMAPVLGAGPAEEIIRRVNALEAVKDVRELRPFLIGGKK